MNYGKLLAAASAAVGLVTLAWLSSGSVWAQDAPDASDAQSGASDSTSTLTEVVVTAERRATNLQTTPISLSAVSGTQLQEQHLDTVTDLQAAVPSFTVNDEGGEFESYNIRGVGNTAITPSITTGVAVFRDGLLLSETIGQNEPLFDIRDTEVLRGPQGTFVGAASTGGAVQINSQDPNFRGINGYVEGQLGNYSDVKSDGAVNLPINDTFAARIAYYVEDRGSFYKDIGAYATPVPSQPIVDPGKYDARDLRVGFLWKPTDNFQALAKIEYNVIEQGGQAAEPNQTPYDTLFTSGAPNAGPPGSAYNGYAQCTGGTAAQPTLVCPTPGASTYSQYYAYSTHLPYVLNYYGTNIMFNDFQTRYGLELRYTLPDGIVIRSMSGFQHIDVSNIQPNGNSSANAGTAYQEIGPNDNYRSEEINIISPTTGKLNWIVGGFWYYRDTPVLNTIDSVNPPYTPLEAPSVQINVPYDSVQRIGAVFGQVNWQFTDALQLQIGVRDNWDNDYNYESPPGLGGVYLLGPQGQLATQLQAITAGGQYKDTVPTGKIGLNWTPVAGQYFYAFYARGYKAGGVSVSPGSLPFNPEHINDYELGWKGTLLDGHLVTQLGGYWMNYQNMQYPVFDINEAQGLTVTNLASSTLKGIEFSAQSKIGHLGVNAGASYNQSTLGAVTGLNSAALPPGFNTPVPYVQCGSPLQAPGGPCFDYKPYLQTVSGEQNPFSPKITANASVDYAIPLGNASLDPRVTYSYVGSQYTSIFQSPYTLVPSRGLLGANLDYINGPWTTELYGTNLANKVYLSGTDGGANVYYGAPRQLGVRLERTF